jgi:murein DD-endopeptidase MepM/ murein hydrolase activator NlpD
MRQPLMEMQLRTPVNDSRLHRPFSGAYGTNVRIAIYGHLYSVAVKKNQPVNEGDPVARTGMSGNTERAQPHLHFGIMTSPLPQHGITNFISPAHVLGYTAVHGLTTDDVHPRFDMG